MATANEIDPNNTTRIESLDALAIAAEAARHIVLRAGRGGTDAVTYEGTRDRILAAMKPFTYDYDERGK